MSATRAEDVLLVLSQFPDEAGARRLAGLLLERRLAACVTIGPPSTAVYRWQGALEQARETPVWIKTTRAAYAAVEACIRAEHPYQLPEIIALPVAAGLPAYLDWVRAETGLPPGGDNA
jgi:periplasmic divalent cation tolerance protein